MFTALKIVLQVPLWSCGIILKGSRIAQGLQIKKEEDNSDHKDQQTT